MNQPHPAPPPAPASGLAPNLAAALSYVLSPLTGILFLLFEKHNPFVRFHAAQSTVFGVAWIVLWVALTIVSTVLSAVPILGWLVSAVLMMAVLFAGFVLWVMLIWRAYNGAEWEIPVVGAQARKLLARPAVS